MPSPALKDTPESMPASGWRRPVRLVLFAVAYLVLAGLCKLAFPPEVQFVSFWLPSGLFVATLLRSETKEWPGYLLAAALANMAFDLLDGRPLQPALLYAFGNCLESLTGAWLVRRYIAPRPDLSNLRQVAGVVGFAAVLSTTLSATIGSTYVVLSEAIGSFGPIWLFWWGGNMIGVLLLAPILLAWPRGPGLGTAGKRLLRTAEILVFLLIVFAVCVFAFHSAPRALLPLTYLVIPCVLWAAFRYGMFATALTNLLIAAVSAWYSTHDFGAIAVKGISPHAQFATHQLSLCIVSLTGLFLAAALEAQRRTQATLKDSEEKFSKVFRKAPVLVSITDLSTGTFLEVNEEGLRLSGFKREEVIGHSAVELGWYTKEERALILGDIAAQGRIEDREMQFRAKDGRALYCMVSGELLTLADRPCMVVTAVDITGLKASERQLRSSQAALAESEARYRLLVEGSPEAVFVLVDATVQYANPAAVRMFGAASEKDLLGRHVTELHHPDSHATARALRDNLNSTGKNGPVAEMRYLRLDGTSFEVESQGARIMFNGVAGIQVSAREITERKVAELERQQFERKLQETQKLESLGVLAGGIAHDFNNILTGILGNASLANLDLPEDSPARDNIKVIEEATKRAADLCRQMLAYSGKGRLVIQKVSLNRLVEETAHLLKISVSKKAEMRFDLDPLTAQIEADTTQVRQVIMNLVINASEAIGDRPGVISLRTGVVRLDRKFLQESRAQWVVDAPEGNYACLEVSDSGHGMSAETQAKIFDPFFTTKFTGRGLGLASVLGIVRGHHGALLLRSVPEEGTTFKVFFPCVESPTGTEASGKPVPSPWRGQGQVLVVDDEETVRNAAARILRRLGFEVSTASDGMEALSIFRADPHRFDLVVMDLTMPNIDGKQALAELRALRPDVRAVLMSGFNQEEAYSEADGSETVGFIQKPFDYESLEKAVREALSL